MGRKRVEHKFENGVELKWCCQHQMFEPVEYFGVRSMSWDGRQGVCRAGGREYREQYSITVDGVVARMWSDLNSNHRGHTVTRSRIERAMEMGVCERCLLPFVLNNNRFELLGPSVDVIDPSKPVDDSNIRVVMLVLNLAKNSHSVACAEDALFRVVDAMRAVDATKMQNGVCNEDHHLYNGFIATDRNGTVECDDCGVDQGRNALQTGRGAAICPSESDAVNEQARCAVL